MSLTIPADASFCPATTQQHGYTQRNYSTRQQMHPASPHMVAALTDVVTVMECAVVGQAGYSQVSLGAQAVQLVLDDELPFSQAQESLHIVCCIQYTHRDMQMKYSNDILYLYFICVFSLHYCEDVLYFSDYKAHLKSFFSKIDSAPYNLVCLMY